MPISLWRKKLTNCGKEGLPACAWFIDKTPKKNQCSHMITTLRGSKAHLSELVNLASGGEEILITVHGEPKARLVPVAEANPDVAGWMRELSALRAAAKSRPARSGRGALDDVREDRW